MKVNTAVLVLILNCASSFVLTGVVGLVQVLIYTSFKFFDRGQFR
ncbi:MAG TPA: hypothetical protein VMM38_05575 [Aridibacter sp.]|nr:hypothetical protein [Aridibacter sp.]